MEYKFSKSSEENMVMVLPELVEVPRKALSFGVLDLGIIKDSFRTEEIQRDNIKKGVSKTMDTLHLPQNDGYSHAIDIFWYHNGVDAFTLEIIAKTDKDRQLIKDKWNQTAALMYEAAISLNFNLGWGGFWKGNWDKPHYYKRRSRAK